MSMSISGGTGGSITPGSDTPKSDSSRSCESEQPATKIDFSSENNTTPVDIEASIQCERIMKVLDGLISRTKMALCIPTLVKDVKELRSVMTPEHLEDVLYIVGLYTTDHIAPSFHNGSSAANMHEITMENIALKKNPELAHLLFIINSYPELQLKIDEIILKMMAVQNAEKDPGLEYLLTLNQFRTLMLRQSTLTASDEIKMKLKVRKFEASNANLINDIQSYTATIDSELRAFESQMKTDKETLLKLQQESHWLNLEGLNKLKKQILDSDRQMVLASRRHDVNYKMLQEESIEARQIYENLLQRNMVNEKNQRMRRFKVETQLMTWIQKYDQEITEKQTDLDESKRMYEEEVEKLADLEKKLAEQNPKYYELIEEREQEYHDEMTRKLKEFTMEHAARVLQVAWRTALQNRVTGGKLRKLQNKLRAQLEREEAKKELLRIKLEKEAKRQERLNRRKNKDAS